MVKRKAKVSGFKTAFEQDYTEKAKDASFNVCTGAIERRIDEYLKEARSMGKYSIAGLCIALGITRERLEAWREGYFYPEDVHDDLIKSNDELAAIIQMGLLHIERYWEECDKSAVQSKHVKMLERSGAFEEKKKSSIGTPPFDLGSLRKFSK